MSYRMYLERRKALNQECDFTEKQYAQAISLQERAVAKKDAAEANLGNGSEELREAREHELLESTARADAAATEVDVATEERDRALAAREDLKEQYEVFEEAAQKRLSPDDANAPADITTRREIIGDYMEIAKGAIDTGLMTGGMIAKIVTATPDVPEQTTSPVTMEQLKQEAAREAISLQEHTTQTYEARVSAPPGELPPEITEHYSKKERDEEREKESQKELEEKRETEEEKGYLESQIEALGGEEHMTSSDDLKEKNQKMLDDLAESSEHPSERPSERPSGHPSLPDPEKSAELIAAQSQTVSNDNSPRHNGPTPANDNGPTPANDNQPGQRGIPPADRPVAMSPRSDANSAAGFPDPDPPASAMAARAPANDNHPPSPANDNDKDNDL